MNAAIISILTEWLSDLRQGYCAEGWWLNRDFCCWEVEVDMNGACKAWIPWSGSAFGNWVIYVLMAVSQYYPVHDAADICAVPIFLVICTSCVQLRALCSGIRNLRNKMHHRWFYYERVPRWLDTYHQEPYAG